MSFPNYQATQHNTMMLTPEHRRSTRTRKAPVRLVNEPKRKSKESNNYDECPIAPEGFEYDREYYLASSRYATYIDEEIAKINRKQKSEVDVADKVDAKSEVDAAILSRDYVYNVHKLIYADASNSTSKYLKK